MISYSIIIFGLDKHLEADTKHCVFPQQNYIFYQEQIS